MCKTRLPQILFSGVILFFLVECTGEEPISEELIKGDTTLHLHEIQSVPSMDEAVLKAYQRLLSQDAFYNGSSNWFWGSVRGGDANKGSTENDQPNMNEVMQYHILPSNPSVQFFYQSLYIGISWANKAIQLADSAGSLDSETKLIRLAEARFLRGHYYFNLQKNFGNTPYFDEHWDNKEIIPNDQSLWPYIEADFLFASENLPEITSEIGRANKWAAIAYLAKAHLFQADYLEAKTLFDDLINNGVNSQGAPFGLLDNFANNFRPEYDNSIESVFAAQAIAYGGTIYNANFEFILNFPHGSGANQPSGCCGFYQPSFDLANSYRTGEDGLPMLTGSYNSEEYRLKTDMNLLSSDPFTPDQGYLDPRIDHSIGRRGIPYLDWGPHPGIDWIREQHYGGPYSPKKFVFYSEHLNGTHVDQSSWTNGLTSINYNLIRFADVLLMAAEAEAELGNLAGALTFVNQVRIRAASSILMNGDSPAANYNINNYSSFSNLQEARDAIRFERKLELSGEGHRFYDLVRWGIVNEEVNNFIDHESQFIQQPYYGAYFNEGRDELLPIPQLILDLGEGKILQNPGYY